MWPIDLTWTIRSLNESSHGPTSTILTHRLLISALSKHWDCKRVLETTSRNLAHASESESSKRSINRPILMGIPLFNVQSRKRAVKLLDIPQMYLPRKGIIRKHVHSLTSSDLYVQFTSYYLKPAHPVAELNIIKLWGPHLSSGKPPLTPKERRSERVFNTTGHVTYTFSNGWVFYSLFTHRPLAASRHWSLVLALYKLGATSL